MVQHLQCADLRQRHNHGLRLRLYTTIRQGTVLIRHADEIAAKPPDIALCVRKLRGVKGNFPKLLYTLQSRRSLFTAKALLGTTEVFLIVLLELIGVLLLGQYNGYLDSPSLFQILYWFVCTCVVSLMLFFSELLLTILLKNPLPALCVGITGSLVGLFSAFMPPVVSYFVPWSYCIPLGTYELVDWNPDTDIVVYGIRDFNIPLLIWCIVLALFFFVCTWYAIREKEV